MSNSFLEFVMNAPLDEPVNLDKWYPSTSPGPFMTAMPTSPSTVSPASLPNVVATPSRKVLYQKQQLEMAQHYFNGKYGNYKVYAELPPPLTSAFMATPAYMAEYQQQELVSALQYYSLASHY